jgi:hypothetical protein
MAKKKVKSYKKGGFANPADRMKKFKNGGDNGKSNVDKANSAINALKTGFTKGLRSALPIISPVLGALDNVVNKPQSRVSETTPPVYNMNRTKEPMPGTRPQKNDRQLEREQFGTNNPTDQQLRDYFDSDEFKSKLPKTPVESDEGFTRRFVSPGKPSSGTPGVYKTRKKGGKLKKAKKRKY